MTENQPSLPAVAMVVAMNRRRVIGVENRLPWHISEDLQHFKRLTLGKPIIMGRKTWDSIGRPLPGRENIVVSSQPNLRLDGATVVDSVDEALALAIRKGRELGVDEVCVIGGEGIYRQLLAKTERVYLTEVDDAQDGDARFPELDSSLWVEIARDCYPKGAEGRPAFCFVTLHRNEASDAF